MVTLPVSALLFSIEQNFNCVLEARCLLILAIIGHLALRGPTDDRSPTDRTYDLLLALRGGP